MPYDGLEDASLSKNVKKLPKKTKKELAGVDEDNLNADTKEHVHGEKCGDGCDYSPAPILVQEVEIPPSLGGATSFSDADEYHTAQKRESNVYELRWTFEDICRNIWRNDEMSAGEKGAAIVKAAQDFADRVAAGPQGQKSLLEKAKDFLGLKSKDAPVEAPQDSAIWVVADKETGDPRWFAVFSNRYQDREGEIFPAKAHKAYEAYVDRTDDYPELRGWHVPGSRFGKADFVGYVDGFMTASGTFDPGMEYVADNIKALNEEEQQGVSHGYYYPEEGLINGIYEGGYRTHEITILPPKAASNWWTAISNEKEAKEVIMGYTKEKAAYLDRLVGPEKRMAVEKSLKEISTVLDGSGIGLKEITEAFASKEAPVAVAEAPASAQVTAPASDHPVLITSAEKPEEELPKDLGAQESEAEKALGGIVERVLSQQLAPIVAQQSLLSQAVKELQRTDDEKVADAIAGKKSTSLGAERPGEIAGNTISLEAAKELGLDPADSAEKALGDTYKDAGPVAPYLMQLVGAGRGRVPQS